MPTFKNIFEWKYWDQLTENIEYYDDCVALDDIGNDICCGDTFDQIYFNKEKLTLEFYRTPEDPNPIRKEFVLKE